MSHFLVNSAKVYHANEKMFDISQNLSDSREIRRSPSEGRPKVFQNSFMNLVFLN